MTRIAIVAALATAGAALALTAVAGGRTNVTTLRATVGPGFTISLTKNGSRVVRLKPGLYRITVADRSGIHNFKLEKSGGPSSGRSPPSASRAFGR